MTVNKKWIWTVAVIVFAVFPLSTPARGAVVEADPGLQRIVGDLYALVAAMGLYRDDTKNDRCPSLDTLERYFKKPLPDSWPEDYRTATVDGGWWAGRSVPEFSRARKFLRSNAPALGLFDRESGSPWLGQSFVWIKALSPEKTTPLRIAQGEDKERLFFNSPGTDHYWWSDLLFSSGARVAILVKYGVTTEALTIPPAPKEEKEAFTASPVSPPPDFTVGSAENEEALPPIEIGDVIFSPVPRPGN